MLFKQRPADFQDGMDVVACYIQHDGEFVLLHRHPHKSNGDRWGLPAGKVEPGESLPQAMRREILEETGIEMTESELRYFDTVYVRHEGRDFTYHMFSATVAARPSIRLSPSEHQAYAWVTPKDSLGMNLIFDLDECTELFYATELR